MSRDSTVADKIAFAVINDDNCLSIDRSVVVSRSLQWHVEIDGKKITPGAAGALVDMPTYVTTKEQLNSVLQLVKACSLCKGNPEDKYTPVIAEGVAIIHYHHYTPYNDYQHRIFN